MASLIPPAPNTSHIVVRGARVTFLGFVLRLGGRFPFLLIAGQLYGKQALGEFAYATALIELVGLLAGFGLRRTLLQSLAHADEVNRASAEALVLTLIASAIGAGVLMLFPQIAFPDHPGGIVPRVFPLVIIALVACDICIAALTHHHLMTPQVVARAIVEPWVLTIGAATLAFTTLKPDGLFIAYAAAMSAAAVTSLIYYARSYALRSLFDVRLQAIIQLVRLSIPVWLSDVIEVGQRRIDLLILGQITEPATVGLYYAGQQVATLVSRMRGSFEPIFTPVMAQLNAQQDKHNAAEQLDQVRFWLLCAQMAVLLALSLFAPSILSMIGPEFRSGATVMIFLLIAELFWGVLGIAELPLLFARAKSNLIIGVLAIAIEAGVAFALVPRWHGLGAALALCSAFLFAGVSKTICTAILLERSPRMGRLLLPMILAGGAAYVVGFTTNHVHFPLSMVVGIPAFLILYGGLLWRFAFEEGDRLLFRRLH